MAWPPPRASIQSPADVRSATAPLSASPRFPAAHQKYLPAPSHVPSNIVAAPSPESHIHNAADTAPPRRPQPRPFYHSPNHVFARPRQARSFNCSQHIQSSADPPTHQVFRRRIAKSSQEISGYRIAHGATFEESTRQSLPTVPSPTRGF